MCVKLCIQGDGSGSEADVVGYRIMHFVKRLNDFAEKDKKCKCWLRTAFVPSICRYRQIKHHYHNYLHALC